MTGTVTSVRQILGDHERALVERLDALRSQIIPLEQELLEVRLAKSALPKEGGSSDQPRLALAHPNSSKVAGSASPVLTTDPYRSPYYRFTMKQLVVRALMEHFPKGATANQLLDLFANVWGRGDIARTSLSPQLSRLREEGLIFRNGHVWHLRHARAEEKAAADQ